MMMDIYHYASVQIYKIYNTKNDSKVNYKL